LDESLDIASAAPREMVQLDDALNALAYLDPRKAKGIELRFFGGLDVDETAEALGVSRETVLRDWRLARAWLKSQLTRMDADG
jgi:RNA polymerase sigma factor (sigma-70 family)